MLPLVPLNATRRLAKDQPEYFQLSVADVAIVNNPTVTPAKVGMLMLDNEVPAMQSVWEPTPGELECLNMGGRVVLTIVGRTHPPISLEVAPGPETPKKWVSIISMDNADGTMAWVAAVVDGTAVYQFGQGRFDSYEAALDEANVLSELFKVPFIKRVKK